ncbi:MAG: O-antigen ligase family protein [Chromatiales bacterium]|nr:O-antigen ligase family protein [Gammaproteobacteria bacterium]
MQKNGSTMTKIRTSSAEIISAPLVIFFAFALNGRLSRFLLSEDNPYDTKRILETALLFGICLILLISQKERQSWLTLFSRLTHQTKLLISGIIIFGSISSIAAPIPQDAFLSLSYVALLFFFTLFIATQRHHYGNAYDKILVLIIVLAVIIYEGAFIKSFIDHAVQDRIFYFHPIFVNSRFLCQFLTWTLPLITLPIFLAQESTPTRRKLIFLSTLLIAGTWWAIAIANGSKGSLLGLLIGWIVVAIVFRGRSRDWLLIQFYALLAGLFIYFTIFVPELRYDNFAAISQSLVSRMALWEQALQLIKDNPLLGTGPLHYAYFRNPYAAHPHNSMLQIASEWGLPVLLMVSLLAISNFSIWVKRTTANPVHLSLTAALLAATFHSQISGVLTTPLSQIMMCLVIGWMYGIVQPLQITPDSSAGHTAKWLFLFVILLSIAGVAQGIFPEVFSLPELGVEWLNSHERFEGHATFNPRFWGQGWLR